MSAPKFVHLHVRSEFSMKDSMVRLPRKPARADPDQAKRVNMLSRAWELGLPAIALTDLNNMFGLVKFYRAAETAGIKPIAGADVSIMSPQGTSELTLLCLNHEGYLSLSRLISRAYLEGQDKQGAFVHLDWLQEHHQGLVALAGKRSLAAQKLMDQRDDLAQARLAQLSQCFPDRLYLELTRTGHPQEHHLEPGMLSMATEMSLPVVASNDVRFLDKKDFKAHEARYCIANGYVLHDQSRPKLYTEEQYLKSDDEMAALFADVPEALANTVELAKRCNLSMGFGTYFLPKFPVPEGETLDTFVAAEAKRGLDKRLETNPLAPDKTRQDYDDRLAREIGVIQQMGFPGYFLIVADFINWAKEHSIPVGPGRGSGAGSLVAWALGITDLDPLPYDLLFERFLNPERVSMPDFDIDFCMVRRDEVVKYVAQQYGGDHVSQIITYGTMAAKAVVRDVGRVLAHPFPVVDGIAKLIPNTLGVSLSDALGRTKKSQEANNKLVSPDLIERYNDPDNDEVRFLLDLALDLEDLTRNAGKHAGGVIIAPKDLTEFVPLYAEDMEATPVTQFDKDDVESVGLVKFDFLGLRTLTILDWALQAVNERRSKEGKEPVDLMQLPLDNRDTYKLFAEGDTGAVFQFESDGMRKLIKQAKPDCFEDIIALAALYRPGPLGSGMDQDWVKRKHGLEPVRYDHELLEPVLSPTYGVIVYQEQVMQIAQVLAGYSLGGADLLRRAMGKKDMATMAKERQKFAAGCAERGIDGEKANGIFDLMEKFAEYGFNKSHSAAYALVAYHTAWLKAHYPCEFMAAVLNADIDSTDKVTKFVSEAQSSGINVRHPHVNESLATFRAVSDTEMEYGLAALKGAGREAVELIAQARQDGEPFTNLMDVVTRVNSEKLSKRVLEVLVAAGAVDGLGHNRHSMMESLPTVMKAAAQWRQAKAAGQGSLFTGGDVAVPQPRMVEHPEWPVEELLKKEHDVVGRYLSGHPLDPVRPWLKRFAPTRWAKHIEHFHQNNDYSIEGVVGGLAKLGRRTERMLVVLLDDGEQVCEITLFGDMVGELMAQWQPDQVWVFDVKLQTDNFSGGVGARCQRFWRLDQLCERAITAMRVQADLSEDSAWQQVAAAIKPQCGGQAIMVLDFERHGHRARLKFAGESALRINMGLLRHLDELPCVSEVEFKTNPDWAL